MDHQEFPWRRRRRRSSLLEHIPEASEIDKSLSYLTRVKDRLISHSLFNLVPWDKLVNTLDHRGRSFLQLWEHRATARLYSSAARYRLHFHFRKLITIYQTQSSFSEASLGPLLCIYRSQSSLWSQKIHSVWFYLKSVAFKSWFKLNFQLRSTVHFSWI